MNLSKRKALSGRSGKKTDVNMMAEGSKCDLIYLMQVGIVQDRTQSTCLIIHYIM